MTQQEIKDTIKDLKDGLNSSFTPEQFKPRMEAKIKELEAQLTTEKKPEKAVTTPAEPKKETPARKKPEAKTSKSNSVTFSNGSQKIEVDIISKDKDGAYLISKKVAKALLKSNKFNDDKWGQMYVTDDPKDDNPYWVFIEDTKDEDEYSVLDDGKYIFLMVDSAIKLVGKDKPSPASERTKFTIPAEPKKETPPASARKKSVPKPKEESKKYPEDEDDYCAKVIAQAKERRRKAKERAKLPQKTEATKNKEKLEKVFDNVKERAEDNNITKAELVKLISETKSLLTMLEKKLASL